MMVRDHSIQYHHGEFPCNPCHLTIVVIYTSLKAIIIFLLLLSWLIFCVLIIINHSFSELLKLLNNTKIDIFLVHKINAMSQWHFEELKCKNQFKNGMLNEHWKSIFLMIRKWWCTECYLVSILLLLQCLFSDPRQSV